MSAHTGPSDGLTLDFRMMGRFLHTALATNRTLVAPKRFESYPHTLHQDITTTGIASTKALQIALKILSPFPVRVSYRPTLMPQLASSIMIVWNTTFRQSFMVSNVLFLNTLALQMLM